MSVNDRLGRLLFIVPYVASRDGVPIQELADHLGVSTRQIEADLNLLCMVGKPPLTPDHLIDVCIDDDLVSIELDQNLKRPLRLTHDEARALVLGCTLVGNLGGIGHELDQVLNKITEILNPIDRENIHAVGDRIDVQSESNTENEIALLFRRAVDAHQEIEIAYYSASSDATKNYILKPLALIAHAGHTYGVALDTAKDDQEKLFRIDRVGSIALRNSNFTPPEELDLERFRTGMLYFGGTEVQADIRFAPRFAHWIKERFKPEDIATCDDGAVQVRMIASNPAWLARWLLPFGQDVEILAPEEMRTHMVQMCHEALAAYA